MARHVSPAERQQAVTRAGALTITLNITLTVLRAAAALVAGSTAVLADAANSGTDILATLVVMGGSRISALPPDPEHPYGHEKAEPVAAKLVGILVTITGLVAGLEAVRAFRAGLEPVGILASWVTAGSIVAKELLARHLLRVGRRVSSPGLLADAANQRTDVYGSLAALLGALGGRYLSPLIDPLMGLVVAGLIARMGLRLYWQAVQDLMDRSPGPAVLEALQQAVARVEGVERVDDLRARQAGPSIHVDCKIGVAATLTVSEGHQIAHAVKESLMEIAPEATNIIIHVNPSPPPQPPNGPS